MAFVVTDTPGTQRCIPMDIYVYPNLDSTHDVMTLKQLTSKILSLRESFCVSIRIAPSPSRKFSNRLSYFSVKELKNLKFLSINELQVQWIIISFRRHVRTRDKSKEFNKISSLWLLSLTSTKFIIVQKIEWHLTKSESQDQLMLHKM